MYTKLLDEAATNPNVTRAPTNLTIPEQHMVFERFKRNTNVVRFNFGGSAVTGYFYGGAAVGTPPVFVIDSMSSYIPPGSDDLDDVPS